MHYGIHVSAYFLESQEDEEIGRAAITQVCLIREGLGTPLTDEDAEYERQRRVYRSAQLCMAEMVGDAEMIRWLNRTGLQESGGANVHKSDEDVSKLKNFLQGQ